MHLNYEKVENFWKSRAKEAGEGTKAVNLGTTEEQTETQIKKLISHLDPSDKHFIDLGCGLGRYVFAIQPKAEKIVAVDYVEDLLEILRSKLKEAQVQNVETVCARCYDRLSVDYGTFDVAIISGVLVYLNDKEVDRTIMNALDLVKSGGKVILRESVGIEELFEVDKFSEELQAQYSAIYRTAEEIEERFKKAGFKVKQSESLYQQRKETGTHFWVFQK